MTEPTGAARLGWVAVVDLARGHLTAAVSLLTEAGISVHTTPTADEMTRVWVDRTDASDARIVLGTHLPQLRGAFLDLPPAGSPATLPADRPGDLSRAQVDQAWAGIVEELGDLGQAGPVDEQRTTLDSIATPARTDDGPSLDLVDLDRVEHFVPPEPPPLPRPDPRMRWAWSALIGGPCLLIGWRLLGWPMAAPVVLIALAGFVGGGVALLSRVRERDPGDDGAIV